MVYLHPPMAYYTAKLKANGDKVSHCFRPFLIENVRQTFAYMDSAIGFISTNLYSLTTFMGILNSMRILYKTFLTEL